ncbi:hypothetical protein GLYMA_12G235200v4 [Glycine max]|uniref:Isopenicillin N synthase-like Fe(2+) 2OG dioxygenase domain-containing protein n=2 Tax=Glycine subgen. Soja TaxID=1462606 RepID=K7LWK7_SOYBN|nr:hypothetical protein GYH30_034716 [Glycine max]KRH27438.1 hypothetical protein GLYMA_12G235200v4 [Glycine max]
MHLKREIRELFEDGIQLMRMNYYYPPCPEPEKVIGLTPHSDGIGLAILLQSNEVEGLQIRKDGVADLRWLQGDAVVPSFFKIY